ncbi:gliding motility-associated C-terminal domain-containing protein, partial [Candidatus Bipolaricaulota bacterium]|nr:gliding motility-associated C-terminal domain-containing protein [Candidatus Bipolaricaulota bacterium]
PSNHSDSAWISVKVGIGGGGTPPSQQSSTMFVDSAGAESINYTDADTVYVKVVDPSHAGATVLANAVEIDGTSYDLGPLAGAQNDTFITAGLSLTLVAGEQITATYSDPTDPTDTSSDTITIIASELDVVSFYASPNPFEGETTFGYEGSGIASVMSVAVYDLAGKQVWSDEKANVTEIEWDGTDEGGAMLANGGYIYVITATDGTNTFNGKGTVFINR